MEHSKQQLNKSMNSPRVFNQFNSFQDRVEKNQQDKEKSYNSSSNNSKIVDNILSSTKEKEKNLPVKVISSSNSSQSGKTKERKVSEINKDNINEDKFKELLDKNEKLEKECIKYKIQLKTMENKIQETASKNYKSNTNTSSKFILPSEFKQMWESLAKENIIDTFVDFIDNQPLVFHLIQDFFLSNIELFKKFFKEKIQNICKNLKIPCNQNNLSNIGKYFRPLIEEFFENIFYDPEEVEPYVEKIKVDLMAKVKEYSKIKIEVDEYAMSDLEQALETKYFKEFIGVMKKIILYCEMHEPPISFSLENYTTRKPVIKSYKQGEIICIDGLPRDNKPCLVLMNPPILKSNFFYMGMKPIVVVYKKGGFSLEDEKTALNSSKELKEVKEKESVIKEKKEAKGSQEVEVKEVKKEVFELARKEEEIKEVKESTTTKKQAEVKEVNDDLQFSNNIDTLELCNKNSEFNLNVINTEEEENEKAKLDSPRLKFISRININEVEENEETVRRYSIKEAVEITHEVEKEVKNKNIKSIVTPSFSNNERKKSSFNDSENDKEKVKEMERIIEEEVKPRNSNTSLKEKIFQKIIEGGSSFNHTCNLSNTKANISSRNKDKLEEKEKCLHTLEETNSQNLVYKSLFPIRRESNNEYNSLTLNLSSLNQNIENEHNGEKEKFNNDSNYLGNTPFSINNNSKIEAMKHKLSTPAGGGVGSFAQNFSNAASNIKFHQNNFISTNSMNTNTNNTTNAAYNTNSNINLTINTTSNLNQSQSKTLINSFNSNSCNRKTNFKNVVSQNLASNLNLNINNNNNQASSGLFSSQVMQVNKTSTNFLEGFNKQNKSRQQKGIFPSNIISQAKSSSQGTKIISRNKDAPTTNVALNTHQNHFLNLSDTNNNFFKTSISGVGVRQGGFSNHGGGVSNNTFFSNNLSTSQNQTVNSNPTKLINNSAIIKPNQLFSSMVIKTQGGNKSNSSNNNTLDFSGKEHNTFSINQSTNNENLISEEKNQSMKNQMNSTLEIEILTTTVNPSTATTANYNIHHSNQGNYKKKDCNKSESLDLRDAYLSKKQVHGQGQVNAKNIKLQGNLNSSSNSHSISIHERKKTSLNSNSGNQNQSNNNLHGSTAHQIKSNSSGVSKNKAVNKTSKPSKNSSFTQQSNEFSIKKIKEISSKQRSQQQKEEENDNLNELLSYSSNYHTRENFRVKEEKVKENKENNMLPSSILAGQISSLLVNPTNNPITTTSESDNTNTFSIHHQSKSVEQEDVGVNMNINEYTFKKKEKEAKQKTFSPTLVKEKGSNSYKSNYMSRHKDMKLNFELFSKDSSSNTSNNVNSNLGLASNCNQLVNQVNQIKSKLNSNNSKDETSLNLNNYTLLNKSNSKNNSNKNKNFYNQFNQSSNKSSCSIKKRIDFNNNINNNSNFNNTTFNSQGSIPNSLYKSSAAAGASSIVKSSSNPLQNSLQQQSRVNSNTIYRNRNIVDSKEEKVKLKDRLNNSCICPESMNKIKSTKQEFFSLEIQESTSPFEEKKSFSSISGTKITSNTNKLTNNHSNLMNNSGYTTTTINQQMSNQTRNKQKNFYVHTTNTDSQSHSQSQSKKNFSTVIINKEKDGQSLPTISHGDVEEEDGRKIEREKEKEKEIFIRNSNKNNEKLIKTANSIIHELNKLEQVKSPGKEKDKSMKKSKTKPNFTISSSKPKKEVKDKEKENEKEKEKSQKISSSNQSKSKVMNSKNYSTSNHSNKKESYSAYSSTSNMNTNQINSYGKHENKKEKENDLQKIVQSSYNQQNKKGVVNVGGNTNQKILIKKKSLNEKTMNKEIQNNSQVPNSNQGNGKNKNTISMQNIIRDKAGLILEHKSPFINSYKILQSDKPQFLKPSLINISSNINSNTNSNSLLHVSQKDAQSSSHHNLNFLNFDETEKEREMNLLEEEENLSNLGSLKSKNINSLIEKEKETQNQSQNQSQSQSQSQTSRFPYKTLNNSKAKITHPLQQQTNISNISKTKQQVQSKIQQFQQIKQEKEKEKESIFNKNIKNKISIKKNLKNPISIYNNSFKNVMNTDPSLVQTGSNSLKLLSMNNFSVGLNEHSKTNANSKRKIEVKEYKPLNTDFNKTTNQFNLNILNLNPNNGNKVKNTNTNKIKQYNKQKEEEIEVGVAVLKENAKTKEKVKIQSNSINSISASNDFIIRQEQEKEYKNFKTEKSSNYTNYNNYNKDLTTFHADEEEELDKEITNRNFIETKIENENYIKNEPPVYSSSPSKYKNNKSLNFIDSLNNEVLKSNNNQIYSNKNSLYNPNYEDLYEIEPSSFRCQSKMSNQGFSNKSGFFKESNRITQRNKYNISPGNPKNVYNNLLVKYNTDEEKENNEKTNQKVGCDRNVEEENEKEILIENNVCHKIFHERASSEMDIYSTMEKEKNCKGLEKKEKDGHDSTSKNKEFNNNNENDEKKKIENLESLRQSPTILLSNNNNPSLTGTGKIQQITFNQPLSVNAGKKIIFNPNNTNKAKENINNKSKTKKEESNNPVKKVTSHLFQQLINKNYQKIVSSKESTPTNLSNISTQKSNSIRLINFQKQQQKPTSLNQQEGGAVHQHNSLQNTNTLNYNQLLSNNNHVSQVNPVHHGNQGNQGSTNTLGNRNYITNQNLIKKSKSKGKIVKSNSINQKPGAALTNQLHSIQVHQIKNIILTPSKKTIQDNEILIQPSFSNNFSSSFIENTLNANQTLNLNQNQKSSENLNAFAQQSQQGSNSTTQNLSLNNHNNQNNQNSGKNKEKQATKIIHIIKNNKTLSQQKEEIPVSKKADEKIVGLGGNIMQHHQQPQPQQFVLGNNKFIQKTQTNQVINTNYNNHLNNHLQQQLPHHSYNTQNIKLNNLTNTPGANEKLGIFNSHISSSINTSQVYNLFSKDSSSPKQQIRKHTFNTRELKEIQESKNIKEVIEKLEINDNQNTTKIDLVKLNSLKSSKKEDELSFEGKNRISSERGKTKSAGKRKGFIKQNSKQRFNLSKIKKGKEEKEKNKEKEKEDENIPIGKHAFSLVNKQGALFPSTLNNHHTTTTQTQQNSSKGRFSPNFFTNSKK